VNQTYKGHGTQVKQTSQVCVLSKQNDMGFMNSRQNATIRIVKLRIKQANTNQANAYTGRAWGGKIMGF
jgi:hypothetical protein